MTVTDVPVAEPAEGPAEGQGEGASASAAPSPRAVAPAILVALGAALSGLQFHRAFDLGPLLLPVLGAAVGACAVALVGARLSDRPGVPVLASVLAAVAASAPLVFRGEAAAGFLPSARSFDALADAAMNGWARMVTTTVPVDPDPDLLAVPFLLTWMATTAGVEAVLRTRARLAALVPAVVVLVIATAAGVGGVGSRFAVPVLFVVVAAALAANRREADPFGNGRDVGPGIDERGGRVMVGALGAGAVVVLVAGLLGPAAPGPDHDDPYDVREDVEPEVEDREAVNPLALLAGWAAEPTVELFEATTSTPVRWRLAVLDRWDGSSWTADSRYTSVGDRLPPAPGNDFDVATTRVRQSVTIRKLDTPWLPVADRPIELGGVDVLLEPESGVVVAPAGSTGARSYEVVSEVPRPTPAMYNQAPTSTEPGATDSTGLPSAVAELAVEVTSTANATSPYQRALLLERFLSEEFTFDPEAQPGHSHLRILQLLGFPTDGAGPRGEPTPGTSEQFAVAFALMARSLGIPTRVVVGFHAGRELQGGRYAVRGGDAFAWPEIALEGFGWVPLDPTPLKDGEPPPPEEQTPEELDTEAEEDVLVDLAEDSSLDDEKGGENRAAPEPKPGRSLWPIFVVALPLVLVATYVVVVLAARRRRRRRRQAGTADARVSGAWSEMLDVMAEHGWRAPATATTAQVVELAVPVVPASSVVCLTGVRDLVLVAVYDLRSTTEEDARVAWSLTERFDGDLSRSTPLHRRIAQRLSPRQLSRPRPAI